MDVITYPYWDKSKSTLVKGAPVRKKAIEYAFIQCKKKRFWISRNKMGQSHGWRWPGSLRRQVIISHSIENNHVPVYHLDGFPLTAPYQCWEMIE